MDVATRTQLDTAEMASRSNSRDRNVRDWVADVMADETEVAGIFNRLTMNDNQSLEEEAANLGRMLFTRCCVSDKVCEICGKSVKGRKGKVAPCGHYFHAGCLPKQCGRDCPTCADTDVSASNTDDDASLDPELSPVGGGMWWRLQ